MLDPAQNAGQRASRRAAPAEASAGAGGAACSPRRMPWSRKGGGDRWTCQVVGDDLSPQRRGQSQAAARAICLTLSAIKAAPNAHCPDPNRPNRADRAIRAPSVTVPCAGSDPRKAPSGVRLPPPGEAGGAQLRASGPLQWTLLHPPHDRPGGAPCPTPPAPSSTATSSSPPSATPTPSWRCSPTTPTSWTKGWRHRGADAIRLWRDGVASPDATTRRSPAPSCSATAATASTPGSTATSRAARVNVAYRFTTDEDQITRLQIGG